jgi:hypothetical protein
MTVVRFGGLVPLFAGEYAKIAPFFELHRFCFKFAIALAFPSGVLGPVLFPPWFLQRPLANAFAIQGCPVDLA